MADLPSVNEATPCAVVTLTAAQSEMADELLGPFATSGGSLLAASSDHGSFTGHDDRFWMLRDTMKAAGVDLAGWDWIVLSWLADQDVQAIAAVARWVGLARLAGLAARTGGDPWPTGARQSQ